MSSSVNSILRASATVRSAFNTHEESLVLTDHILDVLRLGTSEDGCSDLLRAPGQCNLGHLYALLFGEFLDPGGRHSMNGSGAR
jgi:hypothetical protein